MLPSDMTRAATRILVSILSCLVSASFALECIQGYNSTTGRPMFEECPDCDYCVISTDATYPDEPSGVYHYATGPAVENTTLYKPIFDQNDDMYEVMTVCVLEKYTIGFSQYVMRCFCQGKNCNQGNGLSNFVARTKMRDQLRTSVQEILPSKNVPIVDVDDNIMIQELPYQYN